MSLLSKLTRNPDKRDFAMLMIVSLRQVGETGSIDYDPDDFKLRLGTGTQFFLTN